MASLLGPLSVTTLIFGGCCTNVFALEAIVKSEPDSGLLITFFQWLVVILASYPTQYSSKSPYTLGPTQVPFQKWAWIATMFYAINMLNNWAFAFNISVPVHIILRSFGSVITMLAGYIRGKRYSLLQIVSVLILTAGVLFTSWADAESKGKELSAQSQSSTSDLLSGMIILLIAQILSAYMGVYVQDTYATYGANWRENLFYSHFLSLPLFLPISPTLRRQYSRLAATAPLDLSSTFSATSPKDSSAMLDLLRPLQGPLESLPRGLVFLLSNAVMQLACITGVNLLSAEASAVTVTIVLNVRKLVSFMLSTWLFGHHLSGKMLLGSAMVFGSSALWGYESTWRLPRVEANKKQKARKGQ